MCFDTATVMAEDLESAVVNMGGTMTIGLETLPGNVQGGSAFPARGGGSTEAREARAGSALSLPARQP
jgi:hypothetical protein